MPLPTYDKSKRRKSFPQLPKDAYVCRLIGAKLVKSNDGNSEFLEIGFDIAEGEYAGFYQKQYDNMDAATKKWPNDGIFRLFVPDSNSPDYTVQNWNDFFANLEDSNNGYVFGGNLRELKDKLIGGKMHIEQSEYNGNVYDHTRFRYSCVSEDVRKGTAGRLPKDKLISGSGNSTSRPAPGDGFMQIPEDSEEELPF